MNLSPPLDRSFVRLLAVRLCPNYLLSEGMKEHQDPAPVTWPPGESTPGPHGASGLAPDLRPRERQDRRMAHCPLSGPAPDGA